MHTLATATALATLLPFVLGAVDISSIERVNSAHLIPNRYIVELAQADDLAGSNAAKRAYSPHRALYRALRKRGASWSVDEEYDANDLFVGAAVTLGDDSDLKALAGVNGVKSIYPVYIHERPEPLNVHIPTSASDSTLPPDMFSTHKMTGVDKLHAEGFLGRNITIGILDTGIDYTHPTLGGGFGPGFKVIGGTDLVGDDYGIGDNPAVPDPDPLDQCAGHGTHVAGIIGANLDATYNFTGVAPEAWLRAYRVFGCKGGVDDNILVKALIAAYNDGNDIITLSLGGARGWTTTVPAMVASRIAKSGRIVTIAAGNDGQYGGWYSSSPGTALDGFSVASVENTQTIVQTMTLDNGHAPIGYGSFIPLDINGTYPIYALTTDTAAKDDACNSLPDSTPDLSGFVVLIKRGTCTFVRKLDNAAAKGMKRALIYDNVPGVSGGITVGNYTAAIITLDDGKYLVGEFAASRNISVSFPQTAGTKIIDSPTGGLMSTFSTFGPVNDLFFKPSIAAPGGNILSTIPVPLGKYAIESGTSMATPFMAGSAALFLQANGRKRSFYHDARVIFETTAIPLASSKDDGAPGQTLAQTGAGLINVYNAIHYKTLVTPAELNLNDTTHAKFTQWIQVTNKHSTTQLYNVTHVPAGTALTINNTVPIPFPVPLVSTYATMTTGARTLRIKSGETKRFAVKFTPPTGLDPTNFPVYSGNVVIESASEMLSVSYLGVAADMRTMQILDTSSTYFGVALPQVLNTDKQTQNDTTTYTFDSAKSDWPTVVFRLLAGTPDVRIDLVNLASRVVGNVVDYIYQSRNSNGDVKSNGYDTLAWSEPSFANGTSVPDGIYKFKLSALRITGNRYHEQDWETWLSPSIVIKRAASVTSSSSLTTSDTITATYTTTESPNVSSTSTKVPSVATFTLSGGTSSSTLSPAVPHSAKILHSLPIMPNTRLDS